jgi:hypothetical protein
MTDALEELLEQISPEEQETDLLEWLETGAWAVSSGVSGTGTGDEPETGDTGAEDRTGAEEGPSLPYEWTEEAESPRGTVTGQTGEMAGQSAQGREEQADPAASGTGAWETIAGAARREDERSAAELYQQVVRAGYLAGATGGQTSRTVVTQQMTTGAPSLTADQLDRAVRRDSRRYDGGMELY